MLQSKPIYGYMLYSKREQARLPQVKLIQDAIEYIELVEAVYPKNTHVPFFR